MNVSILEEEDVDEGEDRNKRDIDEMKRLIMILDKDDMVQRWKGTKVRAAEMEYCASAARMLAEETWQIAEGFVEVSINL